MQRAAVAGPQGRPRVHVRMHGHPVAAGAGAGAACLSARALQGHSAAGREGV